MRHNLANYFIMIKRLNTMITIHVSKNLYEGDNTIRAKAQDIMLSNGSLLTYLDENKQATKDWANAVIVEFKTDSLQHFTTQEFTLIASDPYGDVTGGTYLMKCDPALLTQDTPEYFSDRTYTDDEEVEHVYTFGEYLTGVWNFEADGMYYFNASHKQRAFSFTEVKTMVGMAQGNVVLLSERNEKKPQVESI